MEHHLHLDSEKKEIWRKRGGYNTHSNRSAWLLKERGKLLLSA